MAEEKVSRQEVEKIVDEKLAQFKNERMRNQRMINSLQEEVEELRNRLDEEDQRQTKKGKREKIELEHKVMRAVAKEIKESRENVADQDAVIERVSDQGHLKSLTSIKIDNLVEDDKLIRQSSGDLVFMDPEMEDIAVINEKYENMK